MIKPKKTIFVLVFCFINFFAFNVALFAVSGDVQWTSNGEAICTAYESQFSPRITSDEEYGAIITWFDQRSGSSDKNIYAQRIDKDGNVQWTSNGVAICTASLDQYNPELISDTDGGAIISWHDHRSASNVHDIYAQRIDADGTVQWSSNGVAICTAGDDQWWPKLVSDGSSGAIITWADCRSGGHTTSDIYAQRIDENGTVQWSANGVSITTDSGAQQRPELVSDGAGGAIITWYDDDIYAQKVDANGSKQWGASAVAISTDSGTQQYPKLVSDGAGGAIITWFDDDIYAQRIDSNGTVQWTSNGVAICNVSGEQKYPDIVADGGGGAIITWLDKRNSSNNIYAQRIDSNGTTQWTSNGVVICSAGGTGGDVFPRLIAAEAGGAIITWRDYRSSSISDIYAQWVNESGTVQWTSSGVAISTQAGTDAHPEIISDDNGGAIITWEDYRTGVLPDIYSQRIEGTTDRGSTIWYLAEGSTIGFDTYILVQNPNSSEVNITITYMDDNGDTHTQNEVIAGNRRFTQRINDISAMNNKYGISTKVESTNGVGIIVERAMYWPNTSPSTWTLAHDSIGVTNTATTWYLAEGSTNGFDTYVLVQNPNLTSASITITYMDENGTTHIQTETVAGNRRFTQRINDISTMNNKFGVSTKVESTNSVGIIAERAMYWPNTPGSTWTLAHDSVGVTNTATTWYLAEGATNTFDTFILVQNPNSNSASITITYMDDSGNTYTQNETVAGNRRFTQKINSISSMNNKTGVSATVESTNSVGVIVERAMYWKNTSTWTLAHDSIGVTSTATTWYLAEGSTSNFDTYVLVQNPTTSDARIRLTYMDDSGNTEVETTTVSAQRRYTRKINSVDNMDGKTGVSTKVDSLNSVGIIVERAMYKYNSAGSQWILAHDSVGVSE